VDIHQLSSAVGVEVRNLDLSIELDDRDFERLQGIFDRKSLVLFRDQTITDDDGRRLIARFGPLVEGIGVVSNEALTGRGELEFHSERSFQRQEPIRGLALYCKATCANGGATLFINCAAAYDALPSDLRGELADTDTIHSFDPRVRLGAEYGGPDVPEGGWQTIHPAVLRHPVTGIPILFVSPWFTTGIHGRGQSDGATLLSAVFDHLSNPAFCYRHQWRPNDLLVWDNLSVIHAREPYDESDSRVLWKYEFRLQDDLALPEPNLIGRPPGRTRPPIAAEAPSNQW
jgi:taurine dioxygenase